MKYKLRKLGKYQFIKDVQSYERDKNLIKITCDNAKLQINFLTEQFIRVRMTDKEFVELLGAGVFV